MKIEISLQYYYLFIITYNQEWGAGTVREKQPGGGWWRQAIVRQSWQWSPSSPPHPMSSRMVCSGAYDNELTKHSIFSEPARPSPLIWCKYEVCCTADCRRCMDCRRRQSVQNFAKPDTTDCRQLHALSPSTIYDASAVPDFQPHWRQYMQTK